MESIYKKCSVCGEAKIASNEFFPRYKQNLDGLHIKCKPCFNKYIYAYMKDYVKRKPWKKKQWGKNFYPKRKVKEKSLVNSENKKWRDKINAKLRLSEQIYYYLHYRNNPKLLKKLARSRKKKLMNKVKQIFQVYNYELSQQRAKVKIDVYNRK